LNEIAHLDEGLDSHFEVGAASSLSTPKLSPADDNTIAQALGLFGSDFRSQQTRYSDRQENEVRAGLSNLYATRR
jgi:hypothetical protein